MKENCAMSEKCKVITQLVIAAIKNKYLVFPNFKFNNCGFSPEKPLF